MKARAKRATRRKAEGFGDESQRTVLTKDPKVPGIQDTEGRVDFENLGGSNDGAIHRKITADGMSVRFTFRAMNFDGRTGFRIDFWELLPEGADRPLIEQYITRYISLFNFVPQIMDEPIDYEVRF